MTNRIKTGIRPGDVIVGRIDADGNPTTDMETAMWTDFLNGTWQKDKPETPGIYPIANRKGQVVGEAMFANDCEGKVVSPTHDSWDGWFFSRPMPKIPNRPLAEWPTDSPKKPTTLRLVK